MTSFFEQVYRYRKLHYLNSKFTTQIDQQYCNKSKRTVPSKHNFSKFL